MTRLRFRLGAFASMLAILAALVPAATVAAPPGPSGASPGSDKAVFFVSDGMRQDLVAQYAAQGLMPTMASFLKKGTHAADGGLLTQAPPNTGAGWYSLATGAWPGVTGSTNNTFHINGASFSSRTGSFDSGVLQAESIAQSAERGGLKVAQVEWAGGREASIQGPTIDYRQFFSGRGVATNFVGSAGDELFDDPAFIAAFGLQFDTPGGYAGQAAYAGASPTPASGWTGDLPTTYSPAMEMRLRVLDFGTDKYGLDAWIFDSTDDGAVNYDQVLFSPTKDADDAVGTLAEGQWADVKVTIQGGSSARPDRGHAGQGRDARPGPVPGPPVPHLRRARDRLVADLARRARLQRRLRRIRRRGRSRPRPPPTTRSSRRASRARRPTPSRASTGRPPRCRCSSTSRRRTTPTC